MASQIDIRGISKTGVDTAFAVFGQIAETIEFKTVSSSSYDPQTGEVNETLMTQSVQAIVQDVDGMDARYANRSELDPDAIQIVDKVVYFKASDVTNDIDSYSVLVRTKTQEVFNIVGFKLLPGDQLYIVEIRAAD